MFSKSPPGKDPRLARYDHFIIHCTATPPTLDVDAHWVNLRHRERGFSSNGYQAVITRGGLWQDADDNFPCRPIGKQGAHVGDCGPGWNSRCFGVSLVGGVDKNERPDFNYEGGQMVILKFGLISFLARHPDPDSVKVMGHRDLIKLCGAPAKACPCFDVADWVTEAGITLKGNPNAALLTPEDTDEVPRVPNVVMALPLFHMVRAGESFWSIGRTYGVSVDRLQQLNPGVSPGHLPLNYQMRLRNLS